MTRKKTNNFINVFKIFFSSLKTYFMYLDQTSKALLFPIFGQIFAIILIFFITYIFNTNAEKIISYLPFKIVISDKNIFITLLIVLIPLFIILIKAIYDYLIMFSSLNIVFYTNSHKKKVKNIDFKANNNVITRRIFKYIILMLLISIMAITPLIILLPFACLTLQVFALEGDVSPLKSITRSIEMVKSNIIPTSIMIILCFFTTYVFLPELITWACQKSSLYYFIMNRFESFIQALPIFNAVKQIDFGVLNEFVYSIFTPIETARSLTDGLILFIITGFTLPFRCCCFTELYRIYDAEKIKENSKMTDEIVKRASSKK